LAANLFTAVYVSRVIFDAHLNKMDPRYGLDLGFVLRAAPWRFWPAAENIERWSPSGPSPPGRQRISGILRGVNIDWLRLKWYFLAFSMLFSVAGVAMMVYQAAHIGSPVLLGVDFKGGTQLQVQFVRAPDTTKIRGAMVAAGIKDASIQGYDVATNNEVLISVPEQAMSRTSTRTAPDRGSSSDAL